MTEICPKCKVEVKEAAADEIKKQYPWLSDEDVKVRAENMNEFFCPNCGHHFYID